MTDATAPDTAELERRARHRAERVRNRRPSSGAPRRFMALGCASAILSVSAFGAVAAASADDETRLAAAQEASITAAAAAAERDVIDLSAIDADGDAANGDTAFTMVADDFTGAGAELLVVRIGRSQLQIRLDVDGDTHIDFRADVFTYSGLTAAEFVL